MNQILTSNLELVHCCQVQQMSVVSFEWIDKVNAPCFLLYSLPCYYYLSRWHMRDCGSVKCGYSKNWAFLSKGYFGITQRPG